MRIAYHPRGNAAEAHRRAMKHAHHHGRVAHGAGLFGSHFRSMIRKAGSALSPAIEAAGKAGVDALMSSHGGKLGDRLAAAGQAAGKAGAKKLVGGRVPKRAHKRPF